MALGRILRENREQQGYSAAQVAEATHMMVQVVEELEREDFHRIAAPIYGRGFVKIYAEFLGIDPAPLVKEFSEIFSGARRPVIATRPVPGRADPGAPSGARVQGSGEGSGLRVQGSGEGSSTSALEGERPREPQGYGSTGSAAALDPHQPPSTPINPGVASAPSAPPVSRPPSPVSRPPSPSRISDELDDLFGHRPAPSPASAPSAASVAPASRHSPLPTPHSPLTTHFSAPLRLCASALKQISASLRRGIAALSAALPARWRSGPVLAGAAAGLLVIATVVILVARSSSSSSSGQGEVERIDGIGPVDSVDSIDSVDHSPLTTPHSPLTTPHSPLPIPTVLPPPEPYID